ncbi:glycosyltransferase family 2 protein [Moorena bouillonii]|uniref:Glycosyltransferase 2-like domain-containing protein n=1 Tax=Moorena bouillonii PNG TaxID=568701 RepID=A0A1U7N725_9CYAN|nr:glycosyltransferase family 2 protein [Moorena bouillonii]OLT61753.1 hypothetical protein BJP37_24725 [Moorena bouillonii PNG]
MRSTTEFAVAIVNYRTPEMTMKCLESIDSDRPLLPGMYVYVVDNNSGDNSFEEIKDCVHKRGWSDWVTVAAMQRNGGFSYGNNRAIKMAYRDRPQLKYVYLLNPDTLILDSGLYRLVSFMDKNPEVGIAGTGLIYPDGEKHHIARRFPTVLSEFEQGARLGVVSRFLNKHKIHMPQSDTPHECDWVSGASMIIRDKVIDAIGLLDEQYFLYYEEVDYCYRAKKSNFQIWYYPKSTVVHIEGVATGINKQGRQKSYWFESRRRYLIKTLGVWGLVAVDVFWALGRIGFYLRNIILYKTKYRKENGEPSLLFWDLLAGDFLYLVSFKAFRKKAELRRL